MTFHLFDDVFRLNLAFETAEGIFQGFALLQSDFCHAPLLQIITAMLVFGTYVLCAPLVDIRLHELAKPELLVDISGLLGIAFVFCAEIEERRLLCGMFAQFSHLIDSACNCPFLFSLISALRLISLPLLPRVFLLPL